MIAKRMLLLLGMLFPFPLGERAQASGPEPVYDFLSNRGSADPGQAIESGESDGSLRLAGEGELRSEAQFSRFHLAIEFKWGERTSGDRPDQARRCWIHLPGGIEVQLLESLSGNVRRNGAGGEVIKNRAWDPAWKDRRGWHSRGPVAERPFGLWNRMDVVREKDGLAVLLNGREVNSLSGLELIEGEIGIRADGAELLFRRLAVHTPGVEFPDSGGREETSVSHALPREFPLSPEESSSSWTIDGDYDLQLVAAEPLVADPVDIAWDENGRMFVAEMRDYPAPPEGGGYLSRIRLILDRDGDGNLDGAVTWAEELDHVQGILAMDGGLVATTRTAVLFLKDTDGDDRADEVRELFRLNAPRNVQLQIANPHWGIDNLIYFNNGLDLREIYPPDGAERGTEIWNSNLCFDPRSGRVEPVSGFGQFGASQDDWGRRFFCSNQNPAMAAVLPLWAVYRNPFDHLVEGHEDIAPSGRDARVYPSAFSYTSSVAHAGTNTSACGLAVYRGAHLPELSGDLFVCEPTGQLVTRFLVREKGVSFAAERVGEQRDFLVSSDEWCRPVNLRNGPDGTLYLCDMYRRFIDHARFFPDGFPEAHFMRAGFDRGRIYRLVRKNAEPPAVEPLPEDDRDLVACLESGNAWRRIHAQEKLVRGGNFAVEPALRELLHSSEDARARVHALWALDGLGCLNHQDVARALDDPVGGVVENAIMLHDPELHRERILSIAENGEGRPGALAVLVLGDEESPAVTSLFESLLLDPGKRSDRWLRAAILSGSERRAGLILSSLFRRGLEGDGENSDPAVASVIRELATAVAVRGIPGEMAELLSGLGRVRDARNRIVFADAFAEGLKRSPLRSDSLGAFLAEPPSLCAPFSEGLAAILHEAEEWAGDERLPDGDRVIAIRLAGALGFSRFVSIADGGIGAGAPPEVSRAVIGVLRQFEPGALAGFFYRNWNRMNEGVRREAVSILATGETLLPLLEKVGEGVVEPELFDSTLRWELSRSANREARERAAELFGSIDENRAGVISRYLEALDRDRADLENGERLFSSSGCVSCHRIGDRGVRVGPDLVNLRTKPAPLLLTEILDPNRMVSRNWMALTVATVDGRSRTGIINGDGNTTLTLDLPGGFSEVIRRNRIERVTPLGMSLMPTGFEHLLSGKEMNDLIFFLKQH